MKVLVTGGAGYVGAHAAKQFHLAGWEVLNVDNLSRGFREQAVYGDLVELDISQREEMTELLRSFSPDVVAHFAAFAYVGESVTTPETYYRNNTFGTLALMEAMQITGCRKLLFSSTCASYGIPDVVPIKETAPQSPINPYGWSKLFVEQIIRDYTVAHGFSAIALRYFNAAGCDADGELGERHDPETHVIPLMLRAALRGSEFTVFGDDYPTPDGTAVRDYIHVTDLADAHVLAGQRLLGEVRGFEVYNLGTATGTSVKALIGAVESSTGKNLQVIFGPRRAGDPPALVADPTSAQAVLGWKTTRSSIEEIVRTAWNWERSSSAPGS